MLKIKSAGSVLDGLNHMLAQSRVREKKGWVVRHRPTCPVLDHHPKELAALPVLAITAVVHKREKGSRVIRVVRVFIIVLGITV